MRYNKRSRNNPRSNQTVNCEGGIAYKPSAKRELYLRVASCLLGEPRFYAPVTIGHDPQKWKPIANICKTSSGWHPDGTQRAAYEKFYSNADLFACVDRVMQEDPVFVLKMAAFAREQLGLRAVPTALLIEYANRQSGGCENTRSYVPHIIKRVDEITECLAQQFQRNTLYPRTTNRCPNLIRRGLADCFNRFDEYQFAKYARYTTRRDVALRDALFFCRPKPIDESQARIFDRIATNTLAVPQTAETMLSGEGNSTETWNAILPSIGFIALLKYLRSIIEHDADLSMVVPRLENPPSFVFPHQYYAAITALDQYKDRPDTPDRRRANAARVIRSLERGLHALVRRIPKFSGRTLIVVDVSASMNAPVSGKSVMTCRDVATLFGAMANGICENATVVAFASEFTVVPLSSDDIMTNINTIDHVGFLGGGTRADKVFAWLNKNREHYDRIILISDMQCYTNTEPSFLFNDREKPIADLLTVYRRQVNPAVILHSIDLCGYGTVQFPENTPNVSFIGGWNGSVFKFMQMFEESGDAAIAAIENYSPA